MFAQVSGSSSIRNTLIPSGLAMMR
jgi:hypothetical protein